MQMKKKLIEEKASVSIYVFIVLFSFTIMLTSIYFSANSVRKTQLSTMMRIKQSYEIDNENIEKIYQTQLEKMQAKQHNMTKKLSCYFGIKKYKPHIF